MINKDSYGTFFVLGFVRSQASGTGNEGKILREKHVHRTMIKDSNNKQQRKLKTEFDSPHQFSEIS